MIRAARVAALTSLLVALSPGGPVGAAFPGSNGMIDFQSNRDGDTEIFVMHADGSGQIQLTDNGARDEAARFSPDGTKIVFSSNRGGTMRIYVMDADGTNVVQLTDAPQPDYGSVAGLLTFAPGAR